MAKRKVDVITHEQFGITVPMTLDTSSMMFEATWARETPSPTGVQMERHTERGKDGEKVRDAMLAFIAAQMTIQWEPVIEVVPLHNNAAIEGVRATAACAIALRRFWLGRPSHGEMQWVAWQTPEEYRARQSNRFFVPSDDIIFSKDFTFPFHAKRRFGGERIYLAYSEEMWAGLQLIEQRIKDARAMLEEMLGSEQAFERVKEIGAQFLPALLANPATSEGQ